MAKGFIEFILECEKPGGGVLLREYLAIDATEKADALAAFFSRHGYQIERGELENLSKAKENAKYLSIDYEYINGPGKSY